VPSPLGILLVVCVTTICVSCGENPGVPPTTVPPPAVLPPPPAPEPTPVEPAALESLTISPSVIGSQSTAQGTVTLTREAPSEGAIVRLASSVVDAARTPASLTVPAGSRSATFSASSPTLSKTLTTIISATYRDVTLTAALTVNPPGLEAVFWFGGENFQRERCRIADSFGHLDINCTFDASASRGFPRQFHWTLQHGSQRIELTTASSIIDAPTTCDLLAGARPDSFGEITLRVDLQVQATDDGPRSGTATKTLKIQPFGFCGY
jgi:hypothetical protein